MKLMNYRAADFATHTKLMQSLVSALISMNCPRFHFMFIVHTLSYLIAFTIDDAMMTAASAVTGSHLRQWHNVRAPACSAGACVLRRTASEVDYRALGRCEVLVHACSAAVIQLSLLASTAIERARDRETGFTTCRTSCGLRRSRVSACLNRDGSSLQLDCGSSVQVCQISYMQRFHQQCSAHRGGKLRGTGQGHRTQFDELKLICGMVCRRRDGRGPTKGEGVAHGSC